MAKKKKEAPDIFYAKDTKGNLDFVDILSVNKTEKRALILSDAEPGDTFGVTEKKLSRRAFTRKVTKLQKKGYEITKKDGASSRMDVNTVKEALEMKYPLEKLSLLARLRPERYPYYNKQVIVDGLNRYIREEIDSLYLNHWATLYQRVLYECYDDRKNPSEILFIDSVGYLLEELGNTLSYRLSREEKRAVAKEVLLGIEKVDTEYHQTLEKEANRKRRKAMSPREQSLTEDL